VDERPALLLSIDFEDWHQLVHRRLGLVDWDRPSPAFVRQAAATFDLLDELGAKATFFILGITAERYPELIGELAARGHEPASHGYAHARVYDQDAGEFRRDLERSIEAIERLAGRRPLAYRAPAFSITRRTPWAYDALADAGFRFDSSQYDSPRVPDRIGHVPAAPYRLELRSGRGLWELPVAVWRLRGRPVPVGGGSYWRVLPLPLLERGLRAVHDRSAYPVVYFHPYEWAPEPLRAALPVTATPHQRLVAASRSVWRNTGRPLVVRRVRAVARRYRLLSYEQAYADIARRYGSSSRSLSEEGVLVRPPV
jgi:polysaccharide deacetylase family protein (PEP-CTERM system associated)